MIESNLAVEIYRLRETASHFAFRERRLEGITGIKSIKSTRQPPNSLIFFYGRLERFDDH